MIYNGKNRELHINYSICLFQGSYVHVLDLMVDVIYLISEILISESKMVIKNSVFFFNSQVNFKKS